MSPEARERSFDALATGLASGSISRGRALKLMGAALVGSTLASLGIGEAAADPTGCKRNGKHCTRETQCCSGNCVNGACSACPSGTVELCNGTCARPCDPDDLESCGAGCNPCTVREVSGAFYCVSGNTSTPCTTSCDCPSGQFCQQIEPNRFCVVAC
jgi:hypothetical protein